jgi:predicted transcriptional regulator
MGLRSCEWIPMMGSMGNLHVTCSLQETQERIERLVGLGLVDKNNNMYRLTNAAFLIANELSTYLHPASHLRTEAIHGS